LLFHRGFTNRNAQISMPADRLECESCLRRGQSPQKASANPASIGWQPIRWLWQAKVAIGEELCSRCACVFVQETRERDWRWCER
jgi:hypothetical protein